MTFTFFPALHVSMILITIVLFMLTRRWKQLREIVDLQTERMNELQKQNSILCDAVFGVEHDDSCAMANYDGPVACTCDRGKVPSK